MIDTSIYLCGVGGQGIGILSEVLIRAADYAGIRAIGVDTHGLAQRGGLVQSHIRLGDGGYSPLVKSCSADLLVALEITEAFRSLYTYGKSGATLVYYDTCWQPLEVRSGSEKEIDRSTLETTASKHEINHFRAYMADLEDYRMQNTVVTGTISAHSLIDGIRAEHYEKAMEDVMPSRILEKNLQLFQDTVKKESNS